MVQGLLPDERWTLVEALFQEAADLPWRSRETFLYERCGNDRQLREEVLSLLRYDTTEDTPLIDALQASAASLVTDEPAAGRMLGPYRIEREIGRGGMSVVYSAARDDGEFQKRVAIKLIRRGMDTRAVIERLRRERRILAALEHPSIARLLDGGTSADGLPWIAMEYVEGLPIHRYCAERRLSAEDICRLFDRVCDAVAYAHRNLVVHRDLKPSNILVSPDGSPKLLDFGIAKVLGAGEDEGPDGPLTRGPSRLLTPEYASPEQKRGGAVGTTTDVYSLGVLLFELLSGTRPGAEVASEAARRNGRDRRWAGSLRGDLDNILQKALREEPERRYLTVEQLQADIRRYLAGQPVSARPETWHYLLGKFLKRHPAGVRAAAAFAVAAAMGVVTIMQAEGDAQAQKAKSEQRLGELVALANTTLFDVHGAIQNLPGATQARLEIARKTTEYLDKLSRESGSDARVLAALASAYTRVARVQGNPKAANLGDQQSAEQNYVKAERILTGLMAHAGSPALQLQDAGVRLEYGQLISYQGRKDDALAQYQVALGQANAVLARDPRNPDVRRLMTRIQLDVADITKYTDPSGTRRTLLKLMPVYEGLVREDPKDTDVLLDMATSWDIVCSTLGLEGDLSGAVDSCRKSATLREQASALRPGDVQIQHDLMLSYGHLGDVTGGPAVINLGDYRGAVAWFGKAAAIAERLSGADPSNALARSDAGIANSRIGISQTAAGEYRQALETFRRAEPLLISALAAAPKSQIVAQSLAFMYRFKAQALHALGDDRAAIEVLRHSLDTCRAWLAKEPENTSWNHILWFEQEQLAMALAATGATDEALQQARSALEAVRHVHIPNDLAAHAYAARALWANAGIHSIRAKRMSADARKAEYRVAVGFYRQALDEWRLHPNRMKEPYLSDMRRTESEFAEAGRKLHTPE